MENRICIETRGFGEGGIKVERLAKEGVKELYFV
jgi:hypothetical protein